MKPPLETIRDFLNTQCPDDTIIEKFRAAVFEGTPSIEIELEDDNGQEYTLPVHRDEKFTIVTKAFFDERCDIEFGPLKVLLAAGDVSEDCGIVETSISFFTLYFNTDFDLITYDAHREFR